MTTPKDINAHVDAEPRFLSENEEQLDDMYTSLRERYAKLQEHETAISDLMRVVNHAEMHIRPLFRTPAGNITYHVASLRNMLDELNALMQDKRLTSSERAIAASARGEIVAAFAAKDIPFHEN